MSHIIKCEVMKLHKLFCAIAAIILPLICVADIPAYKEKFFGQQLDHFNFRTPTHIFQQRYLVNEDYFQKDGAILFYTGNEEDVTAFWGNTGFMFEIAAEFHGLIVFAEHRYYGKSLPFGSDSFRPENIGYLQSEQALADFAELIVFLKREYDIPNAKVIAFGGSYGGMLSAWMRMKYPNIIDAALASSAPVAMFPGLVDQYAYFEAVSFDFAQTAHGTECFDRIHRSLLDINERAKTQRGLEELSHAFSLCKPLKDSADVDQLQYFINNGFTFLAMMDYPYPTEFLQPLVAHPVNESCKIIMQNDISSFHALAAAIGVWYNSTGDVHCFDTASNPRCGDPTGCGGSIAWDYQTCTEMVFPAGTNSKTDFFPAQSWYDVQDLNTYSFSASGISLGWFVIVKSTMM